MKFPIFVFSFDWSFPHDNASMDLIRPFRMQKWSFLENKKDINWDIFDECTVGLKIIYWLTFGNHCHVLGRIDKVDTLKIVN